ncbi:MAG: PfkB family carbohydrate kinase [Pseudomonadota bacterium]
MTDDARPILAVGGENLIDHVTRDGEVTAKPGGSPFNVAMGIGRQGQMIRYLSPISTDTWGDQLAAVLAGSGVALAGGRLDRPTTMAMVTITHGTPSYRFKREGTAERAVTLEDLVPSLEGLTALHTGSMALTQGADAEVWEGAMAKAFAAGCFVSLDPNVRMSVIDDLNAYRERILRCAATAHLIKLSDEDLAELFPGVPEEAAVARLSLSATALILLTRGAEGVTAFRPSGRVDAPPVPVTDLVDTVGAGDTYMATVLSTLAAQKRLSAAALEAMTDAELLALMHRAGTAAAINCAREGCNPPTLEELDAALR